MIVYTEKFRPACPRADHFKGCAREPPAINSTTRKAWPAPMSRRANIWQFLEETAKRYPEKPALLFNEQTIPYGRL